MAIYHVVMRCIGESDLITEQINGPNDLLNFLKVHSTEIISFKIVKTDESGKTSLGPLTYYGAEVQEIKGVKKIIDRTGMVCSFLPDAQFIDTLNLVI